MAPSCCTLGSFSRCGVDKWYGGVLARDGKIYCVPATADTVLCIDPVTCASETFGQVGTGECKWRSGVLALDGKIYGVPDSAEKILCIDPVSRTTSTFGEVEPGDSKWSGGVLARDGRIYCVPDGAARVLCIDPVARSVFMLAGDIDDGYSRLSKWSGGVLAPDGCIYCAPESSNAVLCIDPAAGHATTFGDVGGGEFKWRDGVLADNGRIYCVPGCAEEVLCIDPALRAISTFGAPGRGDFKWRSGVLAEDGKIYCVPDCSSAVLCIDPVAHDVVPLESGMLGDFKCCCGLLGKDGRIYCIPDCSEEVLCIDPKARSSSSSPSRAGLTTLGSLGAGSLKWRGGVVALDGAMFCIPFCADTVLRIVPDCSCAPPRRIKNDVDVLWESELHGCWEPLDGDVCNALETAWHNFQVAPGVRERECRLLLRMGGDLKEIDFQSMEQIDLETGARWRVRRPFARRWTSADGTNAVGRAEAAENMDRDLKVQLKDAKLKASAAELELERVQGSLLEGKSHVGTMERDLGELRDRCHYAESHLNAQSEAFEQMKLRAVAAEGLSEDLQILLDNIRGRVDAKENGTRGAPTNMQRCKSNSASAGPPSLVLSPGLDRSPSGSVLASATQTLPGAMAGGSGKRKIGTRPHAATPERSKTDAASPPRPQSPGDGRAAVSRPPRTPEPDPITAASPERALALPPELPASTASQVLEVELETWRHQNDTSVALHPRSHLVPVLQRILRELVPESHDAECDRVRTAVVTSVEAVANMPLWRQYAFRRQRRPWPRRPGPGRRGSGRPGVCGRRARGARRRRAGEAARVRAPRRGRERGFVAPWHLGGKRCAHSAPRLRRAPHAAQALRPRRLLHQRRLQGGAILRLR